MKQLSSRKFEAKLNKKVLASLSCRGCNVMLLADGSWVLQKMGRFSSGSDDAVCNYFSMTPGEMDDFFLAKSSCFDYITGQKYETLVIDAVWTENREKFDLLHAFLPPKTVAYLIAKELSL